MSKTIELPDGTPHTFTDEEIERGEAMMARLREVEASLVDDTGQTAYSEQLLPCPHCGGEARVIVVDEVTDAGCEEATVPLYAASCPYCGARGPMALSEDEAVEAWNRRSERTCRNASLDPLHFKCSKCAAEYTDLSREWWEHGKRALSERGE